MAVTRKSFTGLDDEGHPVPRLSRLPELTAEQIIMQALDNFNSDDFCDGNFLPVAAQRIIADLEFRHFKIIKLEPSSRSFR